MVPADARQPGEQPDTLLFGVGDVLATMAVTLLLASLLLGTMLGAACLAVRAMAMLTADHPPKRHARSIDRSVSLNSALWLRAEEMRKLKGRAAER